MSFGQLGSGIDQPSTPASTLSKFSGSRQDASTYGTTDTACTSSPRVGTSRADSPRATARTEVAGFAATLAVEEGGGPEAEAIVTRSASGARRLDGSPG